LALPAAVLLTTCIISIVFATLVTRPGKMGGITSEESLKQGKGDLFFFGNFFKMTFDQYQKGIKLTIDNDEHLDSMVMIDLFFSGKALGVKYTRLRYCYTVFIFGIVVAVILALFGFLFMG